MGQFHFGDFAHFPIGANMLWGLAFSWTTGHVPAFPKKRAAEEPVETKRDKLGLQKEELIDDDRLTDLKRRYRWVTDSSA